MSTGQVIYCDVNALRRTIWQELQENLILYVFPPHLVHPKTGPRLFAFSQHGPAVVDADTLHCDIVLGVASLPLPIQVAAPRLRAAAAAVLAVSPDTLSEPSFDGADIRPGTSGSSRSAITQQATDAGAGGSPREGQFPGVVAKVKKAADGGIGMSWHRGRVVAVAHGGDAEKAGVTVGRLIVRVNGKRVETDDDVSDAIATAAADVVVEAVPTVCFRVTSPGGSLDGAACPLAAAAAIAAQLERDAARGRHGRLSAAGFDVQAVRVSSASARSGEATVTPYPPPASRRRKGSPGGTPATVLRNSSGVLKLPAWRRHRQAMGPMGDHEERLVVQQEEDRFIGELYCAARRGEPPSPADIEAARRARDPRTDVALSFTMREVQLLCAEARRQWRKRLNCRSAPAAAAVAAAAANAVIAAIVPTRPGTRGSETSKPVQTPGQLTPVSSTNQVQLAAAAVMTDTVRSGMMSTFSYNRIPPREGLTFFRAELDGITDGLNAAERRVLRRERQGIFAALSDAVIAERRRRLDALALATPQEAGRPSVHGIRRDESVARLKQSRFYAQKQPLPHSIRTTPNNPADTQRLLHSTLCRITDPGAGGSAEDLTLNCKLLRHEYGSVGEAAQVTIRREAGSDLGATVRGTTIRSVTGTAAAAGLRRGDKILSVTLPGRPQRKVLSQIDVVDALADTAGSDTLTLSVVRGQPPSTKEGKGWDSYCCVRGTAQGRFTQGIPTASARPAAEVVATDRAATTATVRETAAARARDAAHRRRMKHELASTF